MTTYVDTNVLAAYYCPEPLSEQAEQRVRRLDPPVKSELTDVELHSALAKKVRREELTKEEARRVQVLFYCPFDRSLYQLVSIVLRLTCETGSPTSACEYAALAQVLNVTLVTWDDTMVDCFSKMATPLQDFAAG